VALSSGRKRSLGRAVIAFLSDAGSRVSSGGVVMFLKEYTGIKKKKENAESEETFSLSWGGGRTGQNSSITKRTKKQ